MKYGAIPFVHGLLEFQITRLDSKFAEMVDRYLDEGFGEILVQSADYFLRTIPVQKSIDVTHHVASYEDASMTAAHATPLPEIMKYPRTPAHEFVILASKLFPDKPALNF